MSANKRLSVAEKEKVIYRVDSGEMAQTVARPAVSSIMKKRTIYEVAAADPKRRSIKISKKFDGADKLLWETS